MSSKGRHYSIFLQPHQTGKLVPISIRARDRDGTFYDSSAVNELLVGTVGVAQVIKRAPQVLDARKRGGLSDADVAISKQSEVRGYMDVGATDGTPYQGNCVIVIKIPVSKRDEIKSMYFEFGINSVDVSDSVRATVDAYYTANGTYSISDMGLAASEQEEAQAYTAFIEECRISADRRVRDICEKHVAYVSYVVILWK